MAEAYAFYEGAFGQAIVLESRSNLVPHSHSESQIVFWLGGARAQAKVGHDIVSYEEDVGVATNAYQAHDMTLLDKNGAAIFLVFMISGKWLNERRQATGLPFVFPSPRIPISSRLRQVCWQVLDLILTGEQPPTMVDEVVERLINATIEATILGKSPAELTLLPPLLDHRTRTAIRLMREHVNGGLTIDDIAAKAGLSRAHLFALFRDQLNTTPQVFWSAVKVEEAMRRLIDQGTSLTSVAYDLGFSAPSNFSRFFKEHTGVSPSAFRRAAGGSPAALPATVTGLSH